MHSVTFIFSLLFLASTCQADTGWHPVKFQPWVSVTVSQITAPAPPLLPAQSAGAVTNEYRRYSPPPERRQCNERQRDGSYIPVRC